MRSFLALRDMFYAMTPSLVLAHRHDATLSDLLLALVLDDDDDDDDAGGDDDDDEETQVSGFPRHK